MHDHPGEGEIAGGDCRYQLYLLNSSLLCFPQPAFLFPTPLTTPLISMQIPMTYSTITLLFCVLQIPPYSVLLQSLSALLFSAVKCSDPPWSTLLFCVLQICHLVVLYILQMPMIALLCSKSFTFLDPPLQFPMTYFRQVVLFPPVHCAADTKALVCSILPIPHCLLCSSLLCSCSVQGVLGSMPSQLNHPPTHLSTR